MSAAELYELCRAGCTCSRAPGFGCGALGADGAYEWAVHPACAYHAQAAEQPLNHRVPWNCPSYWDGCNCVGGPLYADALHALAWMLRTAHGHSWGTRVDPDYGDIRPPRRATTP